MNIFYKGVLLLIVAAFIGESLEFLINIVLARELGEEGLGLYMSILPSIIFLVVIASMELPISISKFIAEKDKMYHYNMLKHTLRFTVIFTVSFLVVAFIIVPQLPIFNKFHPIIPWLILLLIPIISFSSIARGYFMGEQRMGKIAVSNFLRRAIQLVLLVGIFRIFHVEQEIAILIAVASLIGTELFVLVYLMISYFRYIRILKNAAKKEIDGKTVRQQLLAVSVPYTGLRIFHAASFAVKPFLITEALMRAGLTESLALAQYGKLAGVAFAIGFFPAFIAHSLLIALIPAVSESYAKGDYHLLQKRLQQMMVFTLLYGVPAVCTFYFFAEPLTSLFFKDSPAAGYLQILTPYFLFHFFVMPLQAYLIGLGLVKDAFMHSLWSTVISFVLMFFLGSMPQFQMHGIIIGMNTGVVLLTMMHYVTICNKIGLSLTLQTESRLLR